VTEFCCWLTRTQTISRILEDERINLAKVSANGQVTVPVEIRRRLNLKEGDKLLFIEQDDEIIIRNASATAIVRAQKAFAGAATDFGVADSDGVQRLVDQVRRGIKK